MAMMIRDCPHCPATSVAFTIKWNASTSGATQIGAATCGACGKLIAFTLLSVGAAAPDPSNIGGNIASIWQVTGAWPSRQAPTVPDHTPNAVARRFLEGEDAFNRHSWNAAVSMYRSALDIATKGLEGVPEKQTFYKRLIWLRDQGRITDEMKSWADQVRIEGNEALHDPEDFEESDAKPLRLFTEMFLRYIFELPGEVAAFTADTPPIHAT
ncbi:DUF4145 domain-containing protein [Brevundimonas sp.]|uniref:DUF4145 domain-containing protein n=1 Tax=Brevundimonas sp. TaxID=1871086 RepID=UPI00286B0F93|nr:DUF4145 domain-containing protein [Brevundimonas sp.]